MMLLVPVKENWAGRSGDAGVVLTCLGTCGKERKAKATATAATMTATNGRRETRKKRGAREGGGGR